jgi:hypothetical protein
MRNVFEVLRTDVPTANNRIYPELVMRRALERYEAEQSARVVCKLDLSRGDSITVGQVVSINLENGRLMVEAELPAEVFTPFPDSMLHMSPVGVGTVRTDLPGGVPVVQDDYELTSFCIYFEQSPTKLALRKYREGRGRRE